VALAAWNHEHLNRYDTSPLLAAWCLRKGNQP
jgi:hypothetical protein